ncbi:MAG: ATP-dependent DNA ligase [Pseudomonadota bacterium]
MLLAELAATSGEVARTASRLGKVAALVRCLGRLEPGEVPIAVAYLGGDLPQGRIGLGYASLSAALPDGAAATPALTLLEVDQALATVAATTGAGSSAQRGRLLRQLFGRATAQERDFLMRLLLGELRQGALEGVMLEAVARAAGVAAASVRRAAMRAGSLAAAAAAALGEGEAGLARFALTLFRPVPPMLAQPAADVEAALAQLGTAALALPAQGLILDGEALALRPDGTPYPFQETMRRFGRKLDVDRLRAALPLSVFFFDLLLLDEHDLSDAPARERFERLTALLPQSLSIPRLVTAEGQAARACFQQALARGHEGLMAKSLEAPYEAGSRGSAWLKIKQANTLDLVVIAAEWGSGRRRGWLSNLHLGARAADGSFVMLGKTFKGMTDRMLEWQTRELLAREVAREGYVVYVRPELVVEIAFNEIQASPHYPGGLALRFARVKRYRQDKSADQADTIDTVRSLYAAQLHRQQY